jgi:hypothetical protein
LRSEASARGSRSRSTMAETSKVTLLAITVISSFQAFEAHLIGAGRSC